MNDIMGDLLDATLGDLADLPTFKSYPAGTHIADLKWETKVKVDPKDKNKKETTIHAGLKARETVELANPTQDKPLAEGDETTVMFQLNNEFGQGALKNVLAELSSIMGLPEGGSLRAIMEATNGGTFKFVTQVRANKNNADQTFTQIVSVGLV